MSDDDDTRRQRRPRSEMSDDDRAMLDSRRRRAAALADHRDHDGIEVTPVFDALDDELERRGRDTPVTAADIRAFATQIRSVVSKLRADGADSERRLADEVRNLIAHPPNEALAELRQDHDDLTTALRRLARQVDQQGQHVSTHRWLVKLIGGGLMSAVVAVGIFLYTRGTTDGAAAVRLDHVERAVEEVRRIFEHSFQPAWPAPTKDKTP